jgi:hypothetical protein
MIMVDRVKICEKRRRVLKKKKISNETSISQDLLLEHVAKSKEDYDPYHYIQEMNGKENFVDFNWEEV